MDQGAFFFQTGSFQRHHLYQKVNLYRIWIDKISLFISASWGVWGWTYMMKLVHFDSEMIICLEL